jgi:hypothetical protein
MTPLGLTLGLLVSVASFAAPIVPNCTRTTCPIPENGLLQLPFTAIAGDVILTDSALGPVSDVFRIFNNVVNTGSGTGLGNLVFLYSSDDSTPLPDPSTYSANAVFMVETPPVTTYVGNGTNYLLGVPEPGTPGLFALGVATLAAARRTRRRS